jgi:hypothetical protein
MNNTDSVATTTTTNVDKVTYHLWGVRAFHIVKTDSMREDCVYNTWEYIKESGGDRRCLNGIDKREWSQLEIRDSNGKTIDAIETLNGVK